MAVAVGVQGRNDGQQSAHASWVGEKKNKAGGPGCAGEGGGERGGEGKSSAPHGGDGGDGGRGGGGGAQREQS